MRPPAPVTNTVVDIVAARALRVLRRGKEMPWTATYGFAPMAAPWVKKEVLGETKPRAAIAFTKKPFFQIWSPYLQHEEYILHICPLPHSK